MNAVNMENAEHYTWGEGCDGWHFLKDPNLSVIRELVPSGKSETRHIHRQAQQFFYVLKGRAVMELEENLFPLSTGEGLHIPPGSPHRFTNPYDEAVEFLVISSPTTRGDRENL